MEKKNRKGNVQVLSGIAMGVIGLVIIVGIGIVVLQKLAATQAVCAAATPIYNASLELCQNSSGTTAAATGNAYTGIMYGVTQISSTGLLSWLPAVIALLIGVFFLAYFGGKKY